MDWRGWLAIVGSVVGIGGSVTVWISGYGAKAIEEGRSIQRLQAVEQTTGELKDVTGKLKDEVNGLKSTTTGMQSDIKNIYSGQSRIEQGQQRIEKILIEDRKK